MPRPKILLEKCYACGACIYECKYGALIVDPSLDNKVKIDYEKCKQCGKCIISCPFAAIETLK